MTQTANSIPHNRNGIVSQLNIEILNLSESLNLFFGIFTILRAHHILFHTLICNSIINFLRGFLHEFPGKQQVCFHLFFLPRITAELHRIHGPAQALQPLGQVAFNMHPIDAGHEFFGGHLRRTHRKTAENVLPQGICL